MHVTYLLTKFPVQESFTTNMTDNKYDTDYASRKHSQPIEPHNFGHMHASFLCRFELRSIQCKKQLVLVQESMTRAEETCSTIRLVEVFLYTVLSVCPPHMVRTVLL